MITYNEFTNKFVDLFDINKFHQSLGSAYSDELLMYPIFYRQLVLRRIGDFIKLWDINELKELPIGSMLHLIDDNFLMTKPLVFVPDVTGWSMRLAPARKYLLHITEPPAPLWCNDFEKFVLPQQGVNVTILNFRKKYQSFIRTCRTIDDMPGPMRSQVQSVICYDTLYRARIFGMLRQVRRFKYVFSQVLNEIASLQNQNRNHFIPIPVGTGQFDRGQFLRTFKVHERATIRFPEDPWYLFCMHLLGFVHGEKTPSLFEHIPESMWSKIHFILYSKKNFIILRLDQLKLFNGANDTIIIRLIKQLNMLAESGVEAAMTDVADMPIVADTAEDKTLPDPPEVTDPFEERPDVISPKNTPKSVPIITPKVHPITPTKTTSSTTSKTPTKDEQKESTAEPKIVSSKPVAHPEEDDNKSKVSTADKLVKSSKLDKPFKPKILPEEAKQRLSRIEHQLESELVLGINPLEIDDKWLDTPESSQFDEPKQRHNAPAYTTPITKPEQDKFNKAQLSELDKKAEETIDSHTELTKAQTTRAKQLSTAYKRIKLADNKTVEDVLKSTPDDSVNKNTLDYLKDEVCDQSMLNSSVQSFESDYMSKMFRKDLLAELVSFNKVGMFLKDLKVTDTSDALNSTETYVAKYEDINHKEHTIRFILPKVDDRGYCLINGTLKVLKKQRVPNPICKVSNTRVTLNSDYNKYLVERNVTVAHSYITYIDRILKAGGTQANATLGSQEYPNILLPYEYTAIARKYSRITIKATDKPPWLFWFHVNVTNTQEPFDAFAAVSKLLPIDDKMRNTAKSLALAERGVICGISHKYDACIMKTDGSVVIRSLVDEHVVANTTFIDFLCDLLNVTLTGLSEWTDFKLLNKTVPVIFALCYRYGLTHMLNYTKTKYHTYEQNQRFNKKPSDLVIKFANKKLVIPRAPLVNSMLFAGLNNYDLTKVDIEDMDSKDIYYELIQSKHISVHNLKGIDNFFDYFVDPITADVLHQMGEPTEAKDLLIRATQLLTTEDHKPAASSTNFRFRSYERINSAVYKVLSRAHATFKHKAIGASNKFSISDYEIKQLIVQDQLMENVDLINPINDIKYQAEYSHAGFGGRQSIDTFMVDDRQFPDDGTGIISEATVDSSKTAYAASLTMDPTITNMRGMTITKPTSELTPTQVLSPTSILVPGATQDDGKRCNFINIHLSHYVPTAVMEPFRVRTTFEKVVAHRARLPFAYCAEEDGVIESIDDKTHIVKIKYKSGKLVAVQYGDQYTNNGGGGFYCTQNIVLNNFNEKDKIKRGDVIVYNERFFSPDPYSKQVDWCLGAEAHISFMESNNTIDDGNAISGSLARKLIFNPVHVRDIVITKNTTIHKYAAIGSTVKNTDPLLIFDQSEMQDDVFGKLDDTAVDLLAKLNRQTPKAKYTGRIVKIDAFFKCPVTELAPALRGIVGVIYKDRLAKSKAASGSSNSDSFNPDMQIKYTDRIGVTDLDNDTVILRYYIQQDMGMDMGSKIEFYSSLKSVNAYLQEEDWEVEDHSINVQGFYTGIGVNNRIVNSPMVCGIAGRVVETVEQQILDYYFNK